MIDQATPSFDALLADQRIATRQAEALAADYKASADRLRIEHDAFRRQLEQVSAELAELTRLVGAETPIAAFTLAQSWLAEKELYMERIAELEADHERDMVALKRARIYVDRMTIQVGPVPHDEIWQAKQDLLLIDAAIFSDALAHARIAELEDAG